MKSASLCLKLELEYNNGTSPCSQHSHSGAQVISETFNNRGINQVQQDFPLSWEEDVDSTQTTTWSKLGA